MTIEVQITGIDELRERLLGLPDKLRRRALRNALAAGARLIRDDARQIRLNTPTSKARQSSQFRRPGTVARAIDVRTSRIAQQNGDVGVFINVRPLRPGGAKNPDDPYYWQWLEFGAPRINVAARPFLRPAATHLLEALRVIEQVLGAQIQKLDTEPNNPL